MISLHRNTKTSKIIDRSVGEDNYRQCDRAILCKFQAIVESESDCDYEALASALHKAQDRGFVVTLLNLRKAYNNGLYAAAEVAYVSR